MARSNKPLWWALFSAGGVAAALFLPVLIFATGVALPLGWLGEEAFAYGRMHRLVAHPVSSLFLFLVIALSLFHASHRLHAALSEPWLRPVQPFLMAVLYGGAGLGALAAAAILLSL